MSLYVHNKDVLYEISDFKRQNDLAWEDIIGAWIESMQLYGVNAYEKRFWVNDTTYTLTIKENKK